MRFFLFLFATFAFAEPTICLNMIVKDESQVIERCLASVKGVVDYWVIVDTGSTDGTQKIIQDFMRGIPGELHERAWVDFGHNRSEAVQLAKNKGDYLLFIDADEQLVVSDCFAKRDLNKDAYRVFVEVLNDEKQPIQFQRIFLVNNHLNWSWQGVLHEMIITPPEAKSSAVCKEAAIIATMEDGHRAQDPQKHRKDAQALEKALEEDPTNSRSVFYLALTYENAKEYERAIQNFDKRAKMGGWEQEVFWSLYCSAKYKELLEMPTDLIIDLYSKAYQFRPTRAEPLYRIARIYAEQKNPVLAYIISKFALAIPLSQDLMAVESWVYDYGLLSEFANSAYELGKYEEAGIAYEKLLSKQSLPNGMKEMAKIQLKSTKCKPFKY